MINLVNPRSPFLTDEMVMPPLGLMYLSAVLRTAKIEHRIVDLSNNDSVPDGITMVTGTTPQFSEMLKARGKYSVAGGPHASIDPGSLSSFSLIVIGEGEEIIKHIAKNKPTGVIKAKRIKNLDRLPFPNREIIANYHYLINGKRATTAITSRGCNGRCSFCCKAVMNRGIFFRSAQNVISEMAVIKSLGYDAVMFYDDSIAMDRKRLVEICNGISKLDLSWRCFVRSDQVDRDLLYTMADSGCHEILIGVESGSQKILNAIRKNEIVGDHRRAITLAKGAGIRVKALMIVGLPGESHETIEESRNFILETSPDDLDVTVLSVYKGSHIEKHPEKYELSFSEPTFYKGRSGEYTSSVSTPCLSASEIVKARDSLMETFLSTK